MAKLAFTNLRVYIDEKVHPMYGELTKGGTDKSEDFPFIKMPDLFIAAACVGAQENSYKEVSKKKDIFYADAFDQKIQIPVIISLAYKKLENLDDLQDPRKILNVCEGWANGGIHILYDHLMSGQGLRPLYRLVDKVIHRNDI